MWCAKGHTLPGLYGDRLLRSRVATSAAAPPRRVVARVDVVGAGPPAPPDSAIVQGPDPLSDLPSYREPS